MDSYVSLEYEHHRDIATNVKLWVDANPKRKIILVKPFGLESSNLKFTINIQTLLTLDLVHEKAISCDANFGTKWQESIVTNFP
jgi:hypothetical protein